MSDNNDNDKNPLVEISDLTGLSKPATVLVSRVLDGFGAVGKLAISIPQAKVDAKVARIKAKTALDIADMQSRTAFRVGREQMWEQKNLESIVAKAVREIHDKNIVPEEMDDDWISQFNDKAKRVSKDDMQGLWAKILAGEAQAPGSFSPMTMHVVSKLTRADAEAFTNLCAFVTYGHRNVGAEPLVFDTKAPIYQANGVTYSNVMQLEFMNLVIFQSVGIVVNFPINEQQNLVIDGRDFRIMVQLLAGQDALPDGQVMFTQAGRELCNICNATPVKGFLEYVVAEYNKQNIRYYVISRS